MAKKKTAAKPVNITRVGDYVRFKTGVMIIDADFRYGGKFKKYFKFTAENISREQFKELRETIYKLGIKDLRRSGKVMDIYFDNVEDIQKAKVAE